MKGFKVGDCVKDDRDVFCVIEVSKDGTLHLENWFTGGSYDMCDPRCYTKCRKPPEVEEEIAVWCKKNSVDFVQIERLIGILRKYGNSIHIS